AQGRAGFLAHVAHVIELVAPVALARLADTVDRDLRPAHGLCRHGRRAEPSGCACGADKLLHALTDVRRCASVDEPYLRRILVDPDDLVPRRRDAGGRHRAHVAKTQHTDTHGQGLSRKRAAASPNLHPWPGT